MHSPSELKIMIRGAGEQASGIAHRLYRTHMRVFMTDLAAPLCIRRDVSFCEAVHHGTKEVEGVTARAVASRAEIPRAWEDGVIPVLIDPEGESARTLRPHVIVDAILAKRNTGTRKEQAPLVIGIGPGFHAGEDVHVVIESLRGHNLGRVIYRGPAEPNTGIPGNIGGQTEHRVLRAPADGLFRPVKRIGDMVGPGDTVAFVREAPLTTPIAGVLRGILREGVEVNRGLKVGDVDPRGKVDNCFTISEKARALGGGVLEAILAHFFA